MNAEIKFPPVPEWIGRVAHDRTGQGSRIWADADVMDYARAAVALNAPAEADIYWDAEDPEHGGEDCLRDAINNSMDPFNIEDLPVMLRYMRARKMHDIEVEVTGYDDEEGWKYQVLPAGPEAAC